ncbi:Hypothetical protein (Fragment) [Durusdinium trenchii]|uniref:Uncharacterized protein n=1 Tax=Durusdinium trenchii TaxID=1381693 RepID=A0ABP0IL90_9DINO
MIVNAELIYRQPLQVTEEPPQIHPRLYGSNDHWLSHRAQPFYLTPCSVGERNVGWFRAAGVADVKAHFEISARGFQYCYEAAKDGGDIAGYGPAKSYLEFEASRDSTPSYTNGLKVLHLVRRLWACAESNSGSYASCEYNEKTETERVARSLVAVDLHRLWNGNNWTPNLCIAVMAWLISFWHEEPETAYEVLARINDILWLHRDMFTSDGGYASMRIPLLPPGTVFPCFGSGISEICIQVEPSLADNIPYSFLALQARPNSHSHSEVDFGTFTWSAWGARLISEYGYGTIATAIGEWDLRRYEYIDNNPAGHNTVVVREAFKDGEEINFSQLHRAVGELSLASTNVDKSQSVPYGALRADGWMDITIRYACSAADGSFLLVDVLQVKRNRTALSLYGAQYGGPNFDEAQPSARLHLEEYFHIDTSSALAEDLQEMDFDRDSGPGAYKWCSHVDPILLGSTSVVLYPRRGLGSYRPGDGLGLVSGFSTSGGQFIYDGLVDRWFRKNWLKKRRFRFVGDSAVGPEGDARVFVLSPSPSPNRSAIPVVDLGLCLLELGCRSSSAIQCPESRLRWAVVALGKLHSWKTVGTCNASVSFAILDTAAVSSLQENLQELNLIDRFLPSIKD